MANTTAITATPTLYGVVGKERMIRTWGYKVKAAFNAAHGRYVVC